MATSWQRAPWNRWSRQHAQLWQEISSRSGRTHGVTRQVAQACGSSRDLPCLTRWETETTQRRRRRRLRVPVEISEQPQVTFDSTTGFGSLQFFSHCRTGSASRRWLSTTTPTTSSSSAPSLPSSPASSNAFWQELNIAVREGDGPKAEAIVNDLLKNVHGKGEQSANSTPQLDTRIFSLVLEAWKQSQESMATKRAHKLLEQMITLSEKGILTEHPSIEDYHGVLEGWLLGPNSNFGTSLSNKHQEYWQQMRQNRQLQSFLSQEVASSAIQLVQRMMENAHTPTDETHFLLLSILAQGGHVSYATKYLETLQSELGLVPTLEHYNLLLLACARSALPDAAEQATQILTKLREGTNMPSPDGTSYDLVLEAWYQHHANAETKDQAARKAQALLNQMKKDKVRTTLASYQPVIALLSKQGEAIQAEKLLYQLVQDYGAQFDADLKPTLEPFQAVLQAYSASYFPNAAPKAASLLTHMRELYQSQVLDVQPDAWSYNYVLKAWMHATQNSRRPSRRSPKRNGKNDLDMTNIASKAFELLDQMRHDEIVPDTTTLNTLLNILAIQGHATQAETLLWEFYDAYLADPLKNPPLDVISFGTVLKAWSNADKYGPKKRTNGRNAEITQQVADKAESLLFKLQNLHESGWHNCKPDLNIYTSVMKCYSSNKDKKTAAQKVENLLRSMLDDVGAENGASINLKPDSVCWNVAINAWAKAGDGDRADALFQEMVQSYFDAQEKGDTMDVAAPNAITYTAVLNAWAKTQRREAPARAEAMLQQMKHWHETGTLPDAKPNVISYSIVLDCLAYTRTTTAAVRAEQLLREMQSSSDKSVQPNVISYNSVIKAWSLSRDDMAVSKITGLLKEMLDACEAGNDQLTPNLNTFGSVLKAVADSKVPDKERRANVVLNLMEKYGIETNSWSQKQLRRCMSSNTGKIGSNHPQTVGQQKATKSPTKLPDIPELNYS